VEGAKPGSLRLLPSADVETYLRHDYRGMREIIIGEAPEWDAIIVSIGAFKAELNA